MTRFEELLEGYLAGELSSEEEGEFTALLSREENRRIFTAHEEMARVLGGAGRRSPSPSFTEEVFARLPERRSRLWDRVWDLLWTPRPLRWNLASALALGIFVIGVSLVWRTLPPPTPVLPETPRVAILVRFSLYAPGAEQVSLAGDFNGWRTDEVLLSDATGHGHFSVALPLRPGRYAYMFVINGEKWVTDPEAEGYRDDGFGNKNALMRVEGREAGNGDV